MLRALGGGPQNLSGLILTSSLSRACLQREVLLCLPGFVACERRRIFGEDKSALEGYEVCSGDLD